MSCDVLPGSNYIHGQYEIIINGLDYIALNEDLSTWTAVGKAAEILTQQWEKIGHTKTLRPFLEGECVQRLHSHLDYGKEILLRREANQPFPYQDYKLNTHKQRLSVLSSRRMKTFVPKSLLLILANLTKIRHPQSSDSLSFLQTLLTWPDLLEPHFIQGVYLDDIQIERLNTREDTPRLEHCAPWVDQHHPEYWEKRIKGILRLIDIYNDLLKKVLHLYNQSETGYHTMQILFACDVLPGGKFSHGQCKLIFDGHDYIALNEDLSTWTAVGKAAEILTQEWDKTVFVKSVTSFLKNKCVTFLLQHLDYGKEFLLRTDIPKFHVTHKVRADGTITLRCWALDFYHSDITLTWQRDGSNQNLDIEVMDTRPARDGTFQKWAAVVVPLGEEQRYTCHVYYEGLPEPLTLRWEPPQLSVPIMPIVTGLVLGVVLMGAVVTFLIWKRRNKVQFRMSCDVLPGVNYIRGQYEMIFNGHDYIALNEDLTTWTAVGKAAEVLSQEFEKKSYAKNLRPLLEGECVQSLLAQLDYGKEILLRKEMGK
ncbi:patr class I histocompatibility antigen [Cricetulus griseus]|uniref:Patr class I histocompatibility antigen n=1 Tax=Cricetulus griseus TaxID=10029 RepID=A0A061IGZ3_CRIGR|nr:patr class I histocompatibility antigen [Cricetulus griseus]